MSEVYEIYKHSWNPDDEMLYVEAEVADSIMVSSATQFEPDQWTHGRCMTAFIWNDDPLDVPTKETIFDYINNNHAIEWELMVPDDF
tara:strand:- start:1530 stop:1790 length:261 start_codon:yes stop_codon:yes gene_type:complete